LRHVRREWALLSFRDVCLDVCRSAPATPMSKWQPCEHDTSCHMTCFISYRTDIVYLNNVMEGWHKGSDNDPCNQESGIEWRREEDLDHFEVSGTRSWLHRCMTRKTSGLQKNLYHLSWECVLVQMDRGNWLTWIHMEYNHLWWWWWWSKSGCVLWFNSLMPVKIVIIYIIIESWVSICYLSPPKRRDIWWRNLACRCMPTLSCIWAGSFVDRGHRWEENVTFNLQLYIKLQERHIMPSRWRRHCYDHVINAACL